jgi:hypothetical protein
MKPSEIESWAHLIIDRVQAGQPIEDVRVELKSQWPDDAYKTARQIAGHANAAHGEPILWLIGIDERNRQIAGADYRELANWWPKIQSLFSELPPDMIHLNVPYDGKTVVALLFETERRPFVVKVPGGGPIEVEVPWRDGNGTRSAKRRELITILTAASKNPTVEVLKAQLCLSVKAPGHYEGLHQLRFDVYVVPRGSERVVIPYHKCEAALRYPYSETPFKFRSVCFTPIEHGPSPMITCARTEVIIDGPGMVIITACPPDIETIGRIVNSPTVQVELNLWPVLSEVPVPVIANLTEQAAQSQSRVFRQYVMS